MTTDTATSPTIAEAALGRTAASPSGFAPWADEPVLDLIADRTGLDRILAVEPQEHGAAIRHLPSTLSWLTTHFDRFPVLPGVLLLEDLGILSAAVLEADGDEARTTAGPGPGRGWRLRTALRVRFRHFVRPGDSARLEVTRTGETDGLPCFKARVTVDDRVVATVGSMLMEPASSEVPR